MNENKNKRPPPPQRQGARAAGQSASRGRSQQEIGREFHCNKGRRIVLGVMQSQPPDTDREGYEMKIYKEKKRRGSCVAGRKRRDVVFL